MELQYVAKGHMGLSSVSRHAVNAGRKPTDRDLPLEYDELRILDPVADVRSNGLR